MANIDADGQVAYTPITGPFGETIASLNGAQQINTTHLGPAGSSSYLGSYRKTTDSGFTINPTQMGAIVFERLWLKSKRHKVNAAISRRWCTTRLPNNGARHANAAQ